MPTMHQTLTVKDTAGNRTNKLPPTPWSLPSSGKRKISHKIMKRHYLSCQKVKRAREKNKIQKEYLRGAAILNTVSLTKKQRYCGSPEGKGTNHEDIWRETNPRRKASAKTLNQDCLFTLARKTIWLERSKQKVRCRNKVTEVAAAKCKDLVSHCRNFGFY